MLSTSGSADSILVNAIQTEDSEAIVSVLEPRVREGIASASESMLCGVLLLLPPLADYEASESIFSELLTKPCSFEAAVWDAYRYSVVLPEGSVSFEKVLHEQARSAIALHMLSRYYRVSGNISAALTYNRKSRSVRLFPFNLTDAMRYDISLSAETRRKYWRIFRDLLISRTAETDECALTVEGMLQLYWENLILGTRITSELWSEYKNIFCR